MKIIFTLTLFMLLVTTLFANKVDQLQSDDDVNKFLKRQGTWIKDVYVSDLNSMYYDDDHKRVADSLGVKFWQKVDFDNNGLTDLLVYGEYKGTTRLFALIDEGKKMNASNLGRGFLDDILFPVMTTINNQAVLLLYKGPEFSRSLDEYKKLLKTDTLIYHFKGFIEPNFEPITYEIEKIEFSTTMCFGTCPVFELTINSDRTALYNAMQYNKIEGKHKGEIDKSSYEAIVTLLNYLDFPNLKDSYEVNWTDDQACKLVVTYNDGKVKTISDYGEIGTYGLNMLYGQLFSLRGNQKWTHE